MNGWLVHYFIAMVLEVPVPVHTHHSMCHVTTLVPLHPSTCLLLSFVQIGGRSPCKCNTPALPWCWIALDSAPTIIAVEISWSWRGDLCWFRRSTAHAEEGLELFLCLGLVLLTECCGFLRNIIQIRRGNRSPRVLAEKLSNSSSYKATRVCD